MTIHTVTHTGDPAASTQLLMDALAVAQGGDEITLSPGFYNGPTFTNISFPDYVTIRSEDEANKAEVYWLKIQNCSYLQFENLFVSRGGFTGTNAITVQIDDSDHINIYNNRLEAGHHCLQAGDNTFLEIIGNSFFNVRSDSMKLWGLWDFKIQNNTSSPYVFPTTVPDDHVDFIQFQGTSGDGIISGNVHLAAVPGGKVYQGIFLKDGNYYRITIDNNLIFTNSANGIYVANGADIVLSNNTVMAWSNGTHTSSNITTPTPIGSITRSNNIANSGGQQLIQHTNPTGADFYDNLYFNAMMAGGGPPVIQDFTPVPGSPAETMGAFARIYELLGAQPPMAETFTYSLEAAASNGTAVVNADGTGTYDPNVDYVGPDAFSYRKDSSLGGTGVGNIAVTVTSPPVSAPDGTINIQANTQAVFDLKTL